MHYRNVAFRRYAVFCAHRVTLVWQFVANNYDRPMLNGKDIKNDENVYRVHK